MCCNYWSPRPQESMLSSKKSHHNEKPQEPPLTATREKVHVATKTQHNQKLMNKYINKKWVVFCFTMGRTETSHRCHPDGHMPAGQGGDGDPCSVSVCVCVCVWVCPRRLTMHWSCCFLPLPSPQLPAFLCVSLLLFGVWVVLLRASFSRGSWEKDQNEWVWDISSVCNNSQFNKCWWG